MKENVLLSYMFVLTMSFYSCRKEKEVVVESIWPDGTPMVELHFINKADSTYTRFDYFENGFVKSRYDYVNGKANGKGIHYSEDGFKVQEFDYVDGKKNGIGTAWYKSGKISFQFKYKDGLYYDGTEYYEDGWPRVLVKFSAPGVREGKVLYFNENGKVWMDGYFEKGMRDSVWTKYDEKENVLSKIWYKNDVEVAPDTDTLAGKENR